MMPDKYCSKCQEVKPHKEFARDAGKRDGLSSRCRACAAAAYRVWHEANRERKAEAARAWHAANERDRSAAYRVWYEANRERKAETDRAWYEANRERHAATSRTWRGNNRDAVRAIGQTRRARKASARTEHFTDTNVLALYGTDCHLCGGPIDMTAPRGPGAGDYNPLALHIDHVIPLAEGGPHALDNVRPAHARCNLRKGTRL